MQKGLQNTINKNFRQTFYEDRSGKFAIYYCTSSFQQFGRAFIS